jgi:hypothetical protein
MPDPSAACPDRDAEIPRKRPRASRKQTARRRERIFFRLVEGASYLTIAREEKCSVHRVREIVAQAVAAQAAQPPAEFVRLQIARLNDAVAVSHAKMLTGSLQAVDRLVKVVEQLDRYHGATSQAAMAGDPAQGLARIAAAPAPRALPAPEAPLVQIVGVGADVNCLARA